MKRYLKFSILPLLAAAPISQLAADVEMELGLSTGYQQTKFTHDLKFNMVETSGVLPPGASTFNPSLKESKKFQAWKMRGDISCCINESWIIKGILDYGSLVKKTDNKTDYVIPDVNPIRRLRNNASYKKTDGGHCHAVSLSVGYKFLLEPTLSLIPSIGYAQETFLLKDFENDPVRVSLIGLNKGKQKQSWKGPFARLDILYQAEGNFLLNPFFKYSLAKYSHSLSQKPSNIRYAYEGSNHGHMWATGCDLAYSISSQLKLEVGYQFTHCQATLKKLSSTSIAVGGEIYKGHSKGKVRFNSHLAKLGITFNF